MNCCIVMVSAQILSIDIMIFVMCVYCIIEKRIYRISSKELVVSNWNDFDTIFFHGSSLYVLK